MFSLFRQPRHSLRHAAAAVLMLTAVAWGTAVSAAPTAGTADARALPSDAYEQPKYAVLLRQDALELREYAPMLLAEVSLSGTRDQTLNDGFWVLARYIFGRNTARSSIAMTSPVTQSSAAAEKIAMTAPVLQASGSADTAAPNYTVAFMLPSRYTLETVPQPQDPRIQFRMAPAERRAAIRFAGLAGSSSREAKRQELMEFVAAQGLKPVGDAQWAQYDDPFTLPWNRRNEWWVAVR